MRPEPYNFGGSWRQSGARFAALVLAFGVCLVSAAASAQTSNDYLVRLSGSAVIGARPIQEVATAWARALKLSGVRIDAGMDPDEYDVVAEGAEGSGRMTVQSRSHGTVAGLEALLRGQADIWMAARQVRESDLAAMRARNIQGVPTLAEFQQPGTENVIGLTGLAIVVHQRNTVKTLNFQQIRDIYAGKVTSWAQIGGPSNLPIGLYSLDVADTDTESFCATILGIADTRKCVGAFARLTAPSAGMEQEELADDVAGNPAGIGFVSYSARRGAKALALGNACGIGIPPSLFRMKTEEYPLVQRLYLYTLPGRALSPAAQAFLQFALGPAGQAAVGSAGLADQLPSLSEPGYAEGRIATANDAMDGGQTRVRPPDMRAFGRAASGADRLSITFRFQAGTNALDSRGEADMTRLIDLLRQPGYARVSVGRASVALIGFSSATGDYADNRELARDRAEALRARLAAAGLTDVSATGIGPGAAVSCNLDPGRGELNQRVEVWVRRAE